MPDVDCPPIMVFCSVKMGRPVCKHFLWSRRKAKVVPVVAVAVVTVFVVVIAVVTVIAFM